MIHKNNKISTIINDQPIGEDYLNYTKYSQALVSLLLNEDIKLPITVGIYAEWGSGKSFLIGKLKEQIIKKNNKIKQNYIIVNFNAWSYSCSDVLWAGLVKEIHENVENTYGLCGLRCFRHFIYPFRSRPLNVSLLTIFFCMLRLFLLLISTILIIMFTNEEFILSLMGEISLFSVFGLTIISIIPSIITLLINLISNKGDIIMKGAKNIEKKVGFMGEVREELELICDYMSIKKSKFVVFIDDLDRCPPKKIVTMLDATMLLLSNLKFPFLTFIAIDPRIVVKSIENSYDKIILKSGITGFEYLDKLIQIPFSIPMASPKTKDNIVSILMREKEDLLNILIKKIIWFLNDETFLTNSNKNHILQTKNEKYNSCIKCYINNSSKIVNYNYKIVDYNHKIELIKQLYSFLKLNYGYLLDVNFLFDLNETYKIINFLLDFLNYLQKQFNTLPSLSKKKEGNLAIELTNFISIYHNYELKEIKIHRSISETKQFENEKKMKNLLKQMKLGVATDEEFILYGEYLKEKKKKRTKRFEYINTEIKLYYNYLKKFMNTNLTKWSPYSNNLNQLYLYFEKILKNTQFENCDYTFTKEEIKYFHTISIFLDGNCRRNKKIINIYAIVKHLIGQKIEGWYHTKPFTFYSFKILIKLIILFEQWPFRMCFIFHSIEEKKELLKPIKKSYKKKIKSLQQWLEIHKYTNIIDIFKNSNIELFKHKDLLNLVKMDYNKRLFTKFHTIQAPIITIEYFYICIPYIYNINYCIKNKITETDNILYPHK